MDFGSTGITKIEYARRICRGAGHLALQQGDAVGLSCVAKGIVRNIPPRRNPAHLVTVFDVLEQAQPQGRNAARAGAARAGRDDSPAGALSSSSRTCSSSPELLRGCFQHLRFRKHDVAVFHLLDPQELELRLPPADAVPRHGRGPGDLRRAERDRRPLSQGARAAISTTLQPGRAGIGRRLSSRVASTRITSKC